MKHGKKLLALALALCMAFALAVPAFAAETIGGVTLPAGSLGTDTGTNVGSDSETSATNSYTFYQIFKGTYDDDGKLMAVEWGANVDPSAVVDGLTGVEYTEAYNILTGDVLDANPFANISFEESHSNLSADAVARVLMGFGIEETTDNDPRARAFAEVVSNHLNGVAGTLATPVENSSKYTVDLPDPGYYLAVDTVSGVVDNVTSMYMLEMHDQGTYKFEAKADVPKLDKEVLETNDTTGEKVWSDTVADYDIGDQVPFVLTGTVSSRYDDFLTYKYAFHDTLSNGLTLDYNTAMQMEAGADKVAALAEALKVYVDGTLITNGYSVDATEHGFTVQFENLKTIPEVAANSKIQVLYTATLNKNAVVGGAGNTNSAHLEFSNNPNADEDTTGKTPEDIVTVFTFKLVVNKTDDENRPLTGATFELQKKNAEGEYETVLTLPGVDGEPTDVFPFNGLDAGDYKLVETTPPAGYNKAEDMYFKIIPEYKDETDPEKLTGLHIQAAIDANGDEITENGKTIYAASYEDEKTILSADGTPTFPFTGDSKNGAITANIVNKQGVTLPGTGGIGTTIFYVVGGLLIAVAGVVLITKKRMQNAE